MRFSWENLGKYWVGTCADASQRARVRSEPDGWYGSVKCGVSAAERTSGPFAAVEQAKRWAQRAADELRAVGDGPGSLRYADIYGAAVAVTEEQKSEDRIVYLVVTEPGGVDGRDASASGGVIFATFDKGEATSIVGRDSRNRLETKVVDIVEARTKLLRKLSPLDRLLLATAPSAVRQSAFEGDHD